MDTQWPCIGFNKLPIATEMPKDKDFRKQIKAPFTIYADFLAFWYLKSTPVTKNSKKKDRITNTSLHEPCCYSYVVVWLEGQSPTDTPVVEGKMQSKCSWMPSEGGTETLGEATTTTTTNFVTTLVTYIPTRR